MKNQNQNQMKIARFVQGKCLLEQLQKEKVIFAPKNFLKLRTEDFSN